MMRWAVLCRSWRVKVLLLCLLVMALLCCVKWFYLDPSSDREQCVGAQCDNRLAALQSDLEHPVLLPPQLAPPHNPAQHQTAKPREIPLSPRGRSGVPSKQSPQIEEPQVPVQQQVAQAQLQAPSPRIQPAQAPSPRIQPAQAPSPRIQSTQALSPRIQPAQAPPPRIPAQAPSPRIQPTQAPSLRKPAQAPSPGIRSAQSPHTTSLVRPPRDNILQNDYHQAPPLPTHFRNLTLAEVEDVEKFVFFIGYGRSGHSFVASIMDAHPNVIIAHEYYLFDKLTDANSYQLIQTRSNLFDELYWSSYHSARAGWRSDRTTGKGYNLNLGGTWQGQFERLKVIGDKTGGATAMMYHNSPLLFKAVLKRLRYLAGIPYSALHVVRNPYDMIATTALYQASSDINNEKVKANATAKFKQLSYLEKATDLVLTKAAAVEAMVRDCRLQVLEVHLEDLIANPSDVIHNMCSFLGVPCADAYVQTCREKVFARNSRSRDVVVWTDRIRERVEGAIQRFTFFNRYSFEVT